jgi:hypothetical protein
MKILTAVLSVLVLALAVALLLTARELSRLESRLAALEDAKPSEPFHIGLGEMMGYQQRWIDKAGLAAGAGNWDAAAFYVGELQETADDIVAANVTRENQNISGLVKTALVPTIDGVREAVEKKSAALFATRYAKLVGACNACHAATKVPFIHVTTSDDARARWNQIFAPATIEK